MNEELLRKLFPHLFAPSNASLIFQEPLTLLEGAGGDGSGGGGGGTGEGDKRFTQAELDAILEKRLAKERTRTADYDTIKEQAAQLPELQKQIEELRTQMEDAGKSAQEKARAQAERERATIVKQLEEAKAEAVKAAKEREEIEGSFKRHRLQNALASALVAAGAMKDEKAIARAARDLMEDGKAEFSDDGKVVLDFDDGRFTDPKAGAAHWLKSNAWYAEHPGGGAGTGRPNGKGMPSNVDDMTAEEMANLAWSMPVTDRVRQADTDTD